MPHEVHPDLNVAYAEVYEALREHWWYFGKAPSQKELERATIRSAVTIHNAIRVLRTKGLIDAPKFQVRAMKPTDLTRTVSKTPPDPWADLTRDGAQYWESEGVPKYDE